MRKSLLFRFFSSNLNKPKEPVNWLGNYFFKDIVDDAPIAIFTCDKQGIITYYNKSLITLLGRELQLNNTYYKEAFQLYHLCGKAMPFDEYPIAKTLKEGISFNNVELSLESADHITKQILISSRPIFDNDNNLIGAHNSLIDISDKVASKEKENILSSIVSSSDDAIISKDINGVITSWNSGAEKMFGYTEDETIGKHITILIPKERLQEEEIILKNIRAGKKVRHYETIRLHKSGKQIPLSLTISPLTDSNNVVVGASKIARDITELIQTQEMLKNYIDNLEILNSIGKLISEQLDVNVILQRVTDATTKITGASFGAFFYNTVDENNEEMMLYTLSGAPKEAFEKLGKPRHTDLFKPTFIHKEIVRVDDVTKDPKYGNNFPYGGTPEGHLPIVSYMSVPVVSMQGRIIGGLLFGHHKAGIFTAHHEDIISSISSQSAVALENSELFQKVKALNEKKDEFIALASHELKTPLTSIKGYLQLLEKKAEQNNDKIFIDRALYQVEKLNILIADLLNVSKIEAGKLEFNIELFDLKALIIDVIDIFSHSHKSHKIIYNNTSDEVFNIKADKQRLEQVLINLLSNAIKYSPKADKVYINLLSESNNVKVKVKDEGIGLNEVQVKNLFTKFYRAENIANVSGLGLGLYLSKEIITRHEGEITVTSEAGKGSEFCFTLPYNL